jgi:hypothetical protein
MPMLAAMCNHAYTRAAQQIVFTPGEWWPMGDPVITLDTDVAGATGGCTIVYTSANPLPVDGKIIIEFPALFTAVAPTAATADGIDGGLSVTVAADGYTVTVARDGR